VRQPELDTAPGDEWRLHHYGGRVSRDAREVFDRWASIHTRLVALVSERAGLPSNIVPRRWTRCAAATARRTTTRVN